MNFTSPATRRVGFQKSLVTHNKMIKMNKSILFFIGMVLALNSMGQQVAPTETPATVAPTVTEPKVAVTLY